MSNFMDRFMGRKPAPAQQAKDRLKFVLVTDRTTISPEDLKKMQAEILDVIRKYCRVSDEDVQMKFEQRDRDNYLVADIPLKAGRPDEEGGTVRIETTLTLGDDEPTAEASTDKPAEASADTPAEAPADTPAEAPADTPAEAPADKPAEATTDKPADEVKVSGAPTGISTDDKPS